jgi:hypothetical protein
MKQRWSVFTNNMLTAAVAPLTNAMQRAKGEHGAFTKDKGGAEGDSTCAPDYKLQTTDAKN